MLNVRNDQVQDFIGEVEKTMGQFSCAQAILSLVGELMEDESYTLDRAQMAYILWAAEDYMRLLQDGLLEKLHRADRAYYLAVAERKDMEAGRGESA